ncbi:MAG TPA: thioredoxin family protein [Dehalococcoidia bacterium]|nr:thioredoxin family protein [Dehalococcoidia bacterium]
MARQTSVVTPERFAQGLTYADYMNQIKVNKGRMEEYYGNFQVTPEETRALRDLAQRAGGPTSMLVLCEDWCGDVVRGLPVLARIAEAGGLEMRVFPRDEHHDIMNEFLKNGQWMSIPTAVFYSRDHQYICHWIERPEVADREMQGIEEAIRAENPDITEQDFGRERRARTGAKAGEWQRASVTEIVDLLQRSLG